MDKAKEILMYVLAVIIVLSFLLLLALLIFQEVPALNSELLYIRTGFL